MAIIEKLRLIKLKMGILYYLNCDRIEIILNMGESGCLMLQVIKFQEH